MLSPSYGQVTHVLLTRSPLIHSLQAENFIVRLACIRHTASVRPEPGSNSRFKCLTCSLIINCEWTLFIRLVVLIHKWIEDPCTFGCFYFVQFSKIYSLLLYVSVVVVLTATHISYHVVVSMSTTFLKVVFDQFVWSSRRRYQQLLYNITGSRLRQQRNSNSFVIITLKYV